MGNKNNLIALSLFCKQLYYSAIFCLLATPIWAQGHWEIQNPLPTESFLLTVEPVTDNKIIAGGLGGTLLITNNAGKTWDVQKFKDLVNIRRITFIDSLNGWLIDSEHLYNTKDGGESWNEVFVDADMSTYFFLDLICFDNTIYLFLKPQTAVLWELIEAKSLIMKSVDDGKTWIQIDEEIKGKMLCSYFLNENEGFICAEEIISISEGFKSFYKTSDGGTTWKKKIFNEIPWTTSIHFINSQNGFIGKYRTSDGGETWHNMFYNVLAESEYIDDIFFSDSLCGWAVSGFQILQTADGGFSWKVLNVFGSYKLTDINFSKDGTGWIVGWAGNILRKGITNDNWEQISEGTRNSLNDIFFIDENNGWSVGTFGRILHTSNGGKTWENQVSPVDNVFFKIKFLNSLEGWIAGYYVVLHTTDGGRNWVVRNNLKGYFVDIDFFDDKTGLLIERHGNIYRTTDGGENWQIVNEQPLPRLTSLSIVDNDAWIGGDKGLAHTTDRGITIQWYDFPNNSLARDIQFVDIDTGFIANDWGQFLRTSDGGMNWAKIPRGTGMELGPIQSFYMLDQNDGWIYWDYNGGHLINILTSQTISAIEKGDYAVPAISKIYFVNSNTGWAVGAGGTILRYNGQNSTTPESLSARIDVFPNPLNVFGSYIKFTLNQKQNVIVNVFDVLGRRIQTIHDGYLNEGVNILKWIPNNISSGIFFIYVQSEEFNATQKCVFIHD